MNGADGCKQTAAICRSTTGPANSQPPGPANAKPPGRPANEVNQSSATGLANAQPPGGANAKPPGRPVKAAANDNSVAKQPHPLLVEQNYPIIIN